MKSRITIEVNFEENNLPIIQVLNNRSSDDVRDKLITSFLQSLQHTSRWCKIIYMGNASIDEKEPIYRWHIVPVTPQQIPEEISLMQALIKTEELKSKKPPAGENISTP